MKGVHLFSLIHRKSMRGTSVVAGWEGIYNLISSLVIVESPESLKLIRSRDMVVFSGHYYSMHVDELIESIGVMEERGAGALAIQTKPYFDRLPPEVIEACNRVCLPLIVLPEDYRSADIAFALAESEKKESPGGPLCGRLEEGDKGKEVGFFQRIVEMVSHDLSLPTILNVLAKDLSGYVRVEDKKKDRVYESLNYGEAKGKGKEKEAEKKEYYLDIHIQDMDIWVHMEGRPSAVARLGEERASMVLLLRTAFDMLEGKVEEEKDRKRFALSMVFSDEGPVDDLFYGLVQSSLEARGQVLFVLLPDLSLKLRVRRAILDELEVAFLMEDSLSIAMTCEQGFVVVCHGVELSSIRHMVSETVGRFERSLSKDLDYALGLGRPGLGLSSYRLSLRQARQAAGLARLEGGRGRLLSYGGLGVRKAIVDEEAHRILYEEAVSFFGPLFSLSPSESKDLFACLGSFLSHGLSYARAAELLFVHENTLRYRIDKVEDLLSVNFKVTEDVCHVFLLLQVFLLDHKGQVSKPLSP